MEVMVAVQSGTFVSIYRSVFKKRSSGESMASYPAIRISKTMPLLVQATVSIVIVWAKFETVIFKLVKNQDGR